MGYENIGHEKYYFWYQMMTIWGKDSIGTWGEEQYEKKNEIIIE